MNKTTLIIRHEFSQMVRKKAFIIFTFALPVAAMLVISLFQAIIGLVAPGAPEQLNLGYVDEVGIFNQYSPPQDVSLVSYPSTEEATRALLDGAVSEYFVIPPDYVQTGRVERYVLEKEVQVPDSSIRVIRDFLQTNLLRGVSPEVISRVQQPLNLTTTRLSPTGGVAPEQGGYGAFIIPYIFGILLVISIMSSSSYLLQGLGEEKENRIMEVLLSSVSPRQLLAGKVIGLGAAGLVQIVVWFLSASLLINFASAMLGGFASELQVSPGVIGFGMVYFILGYLLFAVLMAGVGALSPTAREAQQLSVVFTLAGVAPFWFMPVLLEHPESPLGTVLTLIPITAPVTAMIRLGLAEVAPWELAASIALLGLSVLGILLLAARLFRVFLLMYGKRPGLREIARALRQA